MVRLDGVASAKNTGNESATKCNEERPWERKIVEIVSGPNMEMMAQQHRNRHPNPRQTREPLESLSALVGEYGGNGRRNQPSGACEVQKGNRSKGFGRDNASLGLTRKRQASAEGRRKR